MEATPETKYESVSQNDQATGQETAGGPRESSWSFFCCIPTLCCPKNACDVDQNDQGKGLRRKFFVQLAGKTNEAHQDFVTRLEGDHHTEVASFDNSDYLLIFCPVVSRVGTDISEALEKIPGDKPTILVVMHHTFNPDHVIAESKRLVEKANITTVDCLFYEDKLLKCERNENAWIEIKKVIDHPSS